MLAGSYVDDPKAGSLAKAIAYSQKAIVVAKEDEPDADKTRKTSAGAAHSTLGYAYLKQDRTAAAIPELRAAAGLLKEKTISNTRSRFIAWVLLTRSLIV